MKKLKHESQLIYKLIDKKITRQEYIKALIEQYHQLEKVHNNE
ncbi:MULTISPECIES: hypothetical protein [unclassified Candidatus Frackibacter]|nr:MULTISPECIES: hypothetical protein [unclassified Candidatus Frackibacter]SDC81064.1 hypothetical protein SAMN04515661_12647 [Candidatus Frackibacter sp. WG11]SEM93474.1 hypothetical protein SAMN04488698_12647 [Candidatus Frackibacter sp. WG12]SFM02416.1 hypothetical protein SAMN04488699_12712 [Candidatus Frackibacter sp. WG13]